MVQMPGDSVGTLAMGRRGDNAALLAVAILANTGQRERKNWVCVWAEQAERVLKGRCPDRERQGMTKTKSE
jgi:phosphoribosylcarboxyaminoimidazole (NCAIR) mutase